jgi:hypothetical protein
LVIEAGLLQNCNSKTCTRVIRTIGMSSIPVYPTFDILKFKDVFHGKT